MNKNRAQTEGREENDVSQPVSQRGILKKKEFII